MTRRPSAVAAILALGVLAVLYNARTYSRLFTQPNTSSMSSVTEESLEPSSSVEDAQQDVPLAPLGHEVLHPFLAALPPSGRDPFHFGTGGPQSASGPPGLPVVQGILLGDTRRVAWINGRARSEGEEVDGHVLRRIEADRVIVVRAGQEYELTPVR